MFGIHVVKYDKDLPVNKIDNGKAYYYIGRGNKRLNLPHSPLANDFKVEDYGRDGCIDRYRCWLSGILAVDNKAKAHFNRLVEVIVKAEVNELFLICWCSPKACHGDVIKEFILDHIENSS